MKRFLFHLNEQPDGTLPPEQWETWEGNDAEQAIRRAAEGRSLTHPKRSFVAEPDAPRHGNGVPMLISSFTITLTLADPSAD